MNRSETLGDRIRRVRSNLSQERFAQMLNVSLKTVQRYERGENRVDAAFLQSICEKMPTISSEWLLLGVGPMREKEKAQWAPRQEGIDEAFLLRVAEGIAEIHRLENVPLLPLQLVRATIRVYSDLMAAYERPEERVVGLKGVLQMLRRMLPGPEAGEE